jgi:fluoroacetyl-CoA thioesterase
MPDIPIGTRNTLEVEVTNDNAISFLGRDDARVLATPWLIMYLEITSRDAVKPYLLDSEDTVGTQVNITHMAATPIGMTARFYAEVKGLNGRRVEFQVEAWDDSDKIAEGTHERFIVDISKFAERVGAKAGTKKGAEKS